MRAKAGAILRALAQPLPLLVLESAFLLAITYAFQGHGPFAGIDDMYYRGLGENLAHGAGLARAQGGGPTAFVVPGYPILLAVFVVVAGQHYVTAVVCAQAVLLALTAYMCGSLALRFGFDGRARLLAQLAIVLYPPFVMLAATTLTETLNTFLVVGAAWLWAQAERAWQRELRGRFIALLLIASATVAGGVAVRPTAVLLPIALALSLLMIRLRRSAPISRCFLTLLIGAAVACALFTGLWGMRNLRVMGEFIPTSTEGYYVAYLGNLVTADGEGGPDDWQRAVGAKRASEIRSMTEVEAMRAFRGLLYNEVRSHPLEVIGLWPKKALRFWLSLGHRDPPSTSYVLTAIANTFLLVGMIVGGAMALRGKTTTHIVALTVLSFVVLLAMAHILTYSGLRYAIPALAFSMVFSAGALATLSRRSRGPQPSAVDG